MKSFRRCILGKSLRIKSISDTLKFIDFYQSSINRADCSFEASVGMNERSVLKDITIILDGHFTKYDPSNIDIEEVTISTFIVADGGDVTPLVGF